MERPDPDKLLAQVLEQEQVTTRKRGKLKIFLGMAAGVGKTYTMLEEAQRLHAEGVEVVVGYVEPHGRYETEVMVEGLEGIPPREMSYKGTTLREFNLDRALKRKPNLILVDELAHTNAEGSRHARRYQDIEELLQAGINVYTTVNIQHIESLNDVVAQITGVIVRETVPDAIVEQADEIEVIDLPPDDLLQRLREGKIYKPEQARAAERNFFRKGNLMALRELALRRAADRVDVQVQDYRQNHAIPNTWPVTERLLVCISPGKSGLKLVRAAKRMATRLRAEWIVAHVETPAFANAAPAKRDSVTRTLRMAEKLGAQSVVLTGQKISDEILNYARTRNVSKIVIGKPEHSKWYHRIFGSNVEEILSKSGVIDVYVLSGEFGDTEPASRPTLTPHSKTQDYIVAALVVALCSAIAAVMYPYFDLSNIVMIYLLGTVGVARYLGRGPSVLNTVLSVAAFDFCFVPPQLTFAVSDAQYLVTFAVMMIAGLVISTLTTRLREQAQAARDRERRTQALYTFGRELMTRRGKENLAEIAVERISELFSSRTAVLLPSTDDAIHFQVIAGKIKPFELDPAEEGVARWVFEHKQAAGAGTDTLPGSKAFYQPLATSHKVLGVLALEPAYLTDLAQPEQMHLLETFANQLAQAIERAELAEETARSQVQIETERLRNSLLSSVSHDLRTPLAAITGSASTLLTENGKLTPEIRDELSQGIYDEAERLNRLVSNLLEVTRLESGAVKLNREWQLLDEIIGASLQRLERQLAQHPVQTGLLANLPPLYIDGTLLEQVFINLLENAAKYSPPGSPIAVEARLQPSSANRPREIVVSVLDRGAGLPPGQEKRIFEKFYRGSVPDEQRGVGLGLTICRGIVEAHGGRIWAENRSGGGTIFSFTLPVANLPAEEARKS